jgi:hypothetical protein
MAKNPSDYFCCLCSANSGLFALFEVITESELELVTRMLFFEPENTIGYSLDGHSTVGQKSMVAQ